MTEHATTEEKPLPTIWRVPDELWERIEPILAEYDPPKRTGRPRVDQRAVLDAVVLTGFAPAASGTAFRRSFPTT